MEELIPIHHLTQALYCQRKLYLQEVLKLGQPSTYNDIKRSILQEALRYTNRSESGIVKTLKSYPSYDTVEDKYYDSARRSLQEALLNHREQLRAFDKSIIDTHKHLWQELMPYIRDRIKNTYDFSTKNRIYGNELWWELLPKITYHLSLASKKLGISMIIDRVDNYPHTATPWLYKSSSPPEQGIWYNHKYELAAAMLLLAEQGLIIQEAILAYEDGKHLRTLDMDPEIDDQLLKAIATTKGILTQKKLPERTKNTKKCEHCAYKHQCYDDAFMQARQQELTTTLTF